MTEIDVDLPDGRTLHAYDSGVREGTSLAVFWHHGTPQTGAVPDPLLVAAAERGVRWLSYDRPGYGGSTPHPGRDVASAAGDVAAIADALGVDRFAVLGASGGGPHALACGALLPERVLGVVSLAGLAPFSPEGLDWFAGMAAAGAGELRAATEGRAALETLMASAEFDPAVFTPADHAALAGAWSSLGANAGAALAGGLGGLLDDDLAYVSAWGVDPGQLLAPVLLVHGGQDRLVPCTHSEWLARRCRTAELWLRPDDGHISVLENSAPALDWLGTHAERG